MASQRQARRYLVAPFVPRAGMQLAAAHFGPLAHPEQPEALARRSGTARSSVPDPEPQGVVGVPDLDVHGGALLMDVRARAGDDADAAGGTAVHDGA